MTQNLKVSVCMITYGHEKYIREAIEGVLKQECDFQVELILANDCSLDRTEDIIQDILANHPKASWIRYYKHEKNIGMMPNFIFAMQQCRGKYVALCEGDDYWTDPLKLQKQVDFLESNEGYSGCFHYTQTIHENGKLGKMYGDHKNKFDFDTESTFSKWSLFHTSSFVFLKSALALPAWLSKVVSGDMALFSIIAAKGNLRCLPEVISVYRKHSGGVTNSENIIKNFHSQRIDLMQYLNNFHNYKYQKVADEIINYHKTAMNAGFKKNELEKSKTDNFLCIPLTNNNLDRYYVRTSIFHSLKKSLIYFQGSLLDIGCGKMPYKNYILENSKVKNYIGLDIENALEYDKSVKPDFVWDGKTMPFENENFDCAFGTEVLEHCPEPEIVLREVLRVLKPGGVFFFTVPFLWNLHEVPHDEYRYTPFSLKRHLNNVGFKDIEIKALGGWHASMAQMLGLWVRRSPMSSKKRNLLSVILKPVIKFLIEMDGRNNVQFTEGQMITGLYGIARK